MDPGTATEYLVEGGRTEEHIVHVGDLGDIPRRKVLVEGSRIIEHTGHVGDPGDIPRSNGAVRAISDWRLAHTVGDSLLERVVGLGREGCIGENVVWVRLGSGLGLQWRSHPHTHVI